MAGTRSRRQTLWVPKKSSVPVTCGFGRAAISENGFSGSVELKTVNNRFLDINLRLSSELQALEKHALSFSMQLWIHIAELSHTFA